MQNAGRRGFAVLLALFAITLFGALATAMVFAATAETRASGIVLGSAQSLSAAESAAWRGIASFDWEAGLSLRPGQFTQIQVSADPIPATVHVVRLDSTCFFIQASAVNRQNPAGNTRFNRRVGITIELSIDSTGVIRPLRVPGRAWTELF